MINVARPENTGGAPASPLFILSCERSGSTLLRYIVDTHPQIACPGHLYLGRLCQSLEGALWPTLGQTLPGMDDGEKAAAVAAEIRRIVGGMMSRYADAKGKSLWCEKTPMNLDYLDVIRRAFAQARYVCLYRHCMDVVHSCVGLSAYRYLPEHIPYVQRHPDNIVVAMMSNWIDKTERLLAFERQNPGGCHRLRYESLVCDTPAALEGLFGFLAVDWSPDLIEAVFTQRHDSGEGDAKVQFAGRISADSVGKGRQVPRDLIPQALQERADALLALLDYPSIDAFYRRHAVGPATAPTARAEQAADDLFQRLWAGKQERLRRADGLASCSCKFVVTGGNGGAWIVDPASREGVVPADGRETSSTVALSAELLRDIADGRKNPMEAYEEGQIEVAGDRDVAFEFGRLLFA
ncbi:sulfotransferase [Methylogaea oryzae]|uniref:SCP2 domain-containing protein n=1 Tax=Methylogaea oryzae TaxID=1295382 RepID=A0A8D5AMJ1_9GAMM|nr:sulfotransferase [Methylogaea oryzae]BBL71145.1 hypothetical protein MoryE10_17510 [Methylogaea oryzae]